MKIVRLRISRLPHFSPKLIFTYLCGMKQTIKINDKKFMGGFILGHLLFNIVSFHAYNSSYAASSKTNLPVKKLEQCPDSLFHMVLN